jgi:hypothetical protein
VRFPKSNKLSPRQKLLLSYLGSDYCKNRIDGENVIYRDLGNYEIEISGCHTKNQPVAIFVWNKADLTRTVESHTRLPQDYAQIKTLLDDIVKRYTNKEENNNE